jgi:hypothetical protein
MGKKKIFSVLTVNALAYLQVAFGNAPLLVEINPNFEPYLYRVHVPKRAQPVYLLGTQHDISLESFPDSIQKIPDQVDLLVEELGPSESTRHMGELSWLSQKQLEKLGLFRKQGFLWVDQVPFELKEKMALAIEPEVIRQWGAHLDQLHPILIRYYLKDVLETLLQGFGIDDEIEFLFRKQKKPVIALENDRERMEAEGSLVKLQKEVRFNGIWNPSLENELTSLFDHIGSIRKMNRRDLPVEALLEYAKGDLGAFLDPNDTSVWIRNRNWIPKILKVMSENPNQSILIMVGLSHFPGEQGLFRLLEEKGFTIEKVKGISTNLKPKVSTLREHLVGFRI